MFLSCLLLEPLEPRRLLAVFPVDPADALPFQRIVLDNDPGIALEKSLADIDGDGRLDAVVGQQNNGGLWWYAFPGSGVVTSAWQQYAISPTGSCYEDVVVRDVNGDGAVDVIASISNTINWFQNPRGSGGNPRTDAWVAHQIGNNLAHDMVVSDFDRDGKFDIATERAIYFQNSPTSWTTVSGSQYSRAGVGVGLLDIGEIRLSPTPIRRGEGIPRGTIGGQIGLDDAFQDRVLSAPIDLVGSGPSNSPYAIYWYENPIHCGGNPRTDTWVRHYVGPVFDPNWSTVGYAFDTMDVNRDGRMDIISVQGEQPNDMQPPPPEGVAWWEAPVDRRNGTWIRHQIDVTLAKIHRARIVDMNGDQLPDIVVAEQEQSSTDRVAILYNANNGGQDWYIQVISTGSGHNQFVADIDGDGDYDILNAPHGVYGAPHPLELFVNGKYTPAGTAPVINASPASRTIQIGQSVTFVVAATGATPLSYQWQRNGTNIPGATGVSYTLNAAAASDNGAEFQVIVTNPINSVTSAAATLTVTPAQSAYLSDLNPTFAANGWGPYERDRSNGEQGAKDGNTITLNGVQYPKGLGVHAASELRYSLAGQYATFVSDVGVDDEVGAGGSVIFQVWADGIKIYDSGTMTGSSATKSVSVSVAGKNELRLIVTDAGNGNSTDHADWAGARLLAPAAVFATRSAPFSLIGRSARDELDELPIPPLD